jgi:glycosyltransferase involved in cell wall biosynthesis
MFGGGEVWLLTMMRELRCRGHNVNLLCRPGVSLENRAKNEDFDVYTVKMRGDFDPVTIFHIWKLMRRLKPDIVCTNMDKELRVGGIAAKLAGIKAVIPRRGIDYPLKNSWVYRWSYTKLASGVIANSEATKESLLENCPWLHPDSIQVIYNGVDHVQFSLPPEKDLRKEFGIHPNDFLIGFVGQLDERKGVDSLLKAYKQISEKCPNSVLLIVGTGKMESHLRVLASKTTGCVIFAGYRDDVMEIMKTIDVLVLPSLWEGFGIVIIEAMAAGKPVVSTRISNIPEIVTHMEDGLLVKPGDAKLLSESLNSLMKDPKLAKKMGRAGRKKVKVNFTMKRMVDETEAFFRFHMAK